MDLKAVIIQGYTVFLNISMTVTETHEVLYQSNKKDFHFILTNFHVLDDFHATNNHYYLKLKLYRLYAIDTMYFSKVKIFP